MKQNIVQAALFGVAVGDALGVPAEFKSRSTLQREPVTDFEGFKSHNQPPGTFSDDSSLTFCLAESLCNGYNLQDIAQKFMAWLDTSYWAAHNEVFDIGITTQSAINNLRRGGKPELAGGFEENDNGNGSLMRILPLVFYTYNLPIEQRYQATKEVSSITHGHIRSVIACFYYLEFALLLLNDSDKQTAYKEAAIIVEEFLKAQRINQAEIDLFAPLFKEDISLQPLEAIPSSGYVMATIKAAIWCLMTTDNYKDAVIKAVNMGSDTDTTAAVAGGLAGIYYGYENIPETWRTKLARSKDIYDLATRLATAQKI